MLLLGRAHYISELRTLSDDEMMFLNIQNESQELQTFLYYNQKDITECESTYDICDVLKIEYPENIFSISWLVT